MRKEEKFLFPAIPRMEAAVAAGDPVPQSPFGLVRHAILMMEHDHGVVMRHLDDIRDITCGYDLREDACISLRALVPGNVRPPRGRLAHAHPTGRRYSGSHIWSASVALSSSHQGRAGYSPALRGRC
jgi:hypothetical protein